MRRSHLTASPGVRLLVLAVLLLAGAAYTVALLPPPRWTLDVGTPGDSLFLDDFFAAEQGSEGQSFRWSGLHSRLWLHGTTSAPQVLRLHLYGDRLAQQDDPRLRLQRGDQLFVTFAARPGWRTYHVLLPAGAAVRSTGATRPIELAIAPYCPDSSDNRVLGVPLDWLGLTRLESASPHVAAPLRGALLLVWVLALVAWALWHIERHYRRRNRHSIGRVRMVWLYRPLALLVAALALLALALLARPALVWALVWAPWVLGVATLLLAASHYARGRMDTVYLPPVAQRALPWALLVLLVLAHALLWLPRSVEWQSAGVWLVMMLPGALLAVWLFRAEADPLLLTFLGWCGAVALPPLLLLLVHLLPGAPPWWLLLLCDAASVALIGAFVRAQAAAELRPLPLKLSPSLAALALVLLLAAALRLPFLGSAEFQGDEARAMLLAMNVQHGRDDILLLHRKGPIEVLLPAAPLVLTGVVNEWSARLPFALAGVGVVLGGYTLMRRMVAGPLGSIAGLLAALIIATEGFLLAFSRIVQYQSVLVLMASGAVLCGWRFYAGTAHPRRYLLAAALLAAVGMLAHYDGIYVLPVLAWLVLAGGRRYWHSVGHWARGLAAPLLVGALLVGGFYVPFFTHEHFGNTLDYLSTRVDPDNVPKLLFHNLVFHYDWATFYNTTVQVEWLTVMLAAGVAAWLPRYARPRWLGWLLGGLWLLGWLLTVLAPEAFAVGERLNWAIVALGVPLAALAAFPATPAPLRTLVLWFAPPFAALSFIIADPRTHYYAMNAPAALLIALAVAHLVLWLRAHPLPVVRLARVPLALAGAALLLLAVPYLFIVFVQQQPEYQRMFPQARPALYTDLASDQVPWNGIFGFPHRDGWKVVGQLYRQGIVQGTYHTNQRDRMGIWYTRGEAMCEPQPDYFFLATWDGANLDEKMADGADADDYALAACVLVDDRRMLNIHTRRPHPQPPQVLRLDQQTIRAFDQWEMSYFPLREALNTSVPQYPLDAAWQGQGGIRLVGYDLKRQQAAPGEFASLALHWRVAAAPNPAYEPVVTLRDADGILVAEARPLCSPPPLAAWSPYYINTVSFALQDGAPLAPGRYTLHASLHHRETSAVLPLADGAETFEVAPFVVAEAEASGEQP